MIGVMGASGATGRLVSQMLAESGLALRLGARRPELVPEVGERFAVDLRDTDLLKRFCDGCDVVVNCAGPSYEVLTTVADAALACDADYVDPAGDDPVHARLGARDLGGRTAIVSAGLLPGLGGLLPRLAATRVTRPRRLHGLAGGIAPLTSAAARDFLLSEGAGIGEPLAQRRNGIRESRALRPIRDVRLPFFPGRVSAYPYLPTEWERVAAHLGVRDASWYNVFPLGRADQVLGRVWGEGASDVDAAACVLQQAVAIDLVGRTPYHWLIVQAKGEGGELATVVLGSGDGYQPTAAMTVAAVLTLRAGTVAPGVHFAAELLDPVSMGHTLRRLPGVTVTESGSEVGLIDPVATLQDEDGDL